MYRRDHTSYILAALCKFSSNGYSYPRTRRQNVWNTSYFNSYYVYYPWTRRQYVSNISYYKFCYGGEGCCTVLCTLKWLLVFTSQGTESAPQWRPWVDMCCSGGTESTPQWRPWVDYVLFRRHRVHATVAAVGGQSLLQDAQSPEEDQAKLTAALTYTTTIQAAKIKYRYQHQKNIRKDWQKN